jgi:signal peptidase I
MNSSSDRAAHQTTGLRRHARVLTHAVLAGVVLGAIAFTSGAAAQGFYVDGISMAPSLHTGQLLLVNKASVWGVTSPLPEAIEPLFSGPRRGDVVVFQSPTTPDHNLVKRIIGLPGDTVLIETGTVFVNGTALDEPYLENKATYTYPQNDEPLTVPEGQYFVLGDNRPHSGDSHEGWFVPAENLRGEVLALPWTIVDDA